MTSIGIAGAIAAAIAVAAVRPAEASVDRYAVLIANNTGDADEPALHYAESDADKLREVLVDLGGFPAENVTQLEGQGADAVKKALIVANDRIRSASRQTVLLVFYSGHADAESLHLSGTRLEIETLQRLVRGSSAEVRLLIVDACRSGVLTRSKGGRRGGSFALAIDERLSSEGVVFLTASAANEDAQESDELKGSFFTHYLVSGLLGAADQDGDSQVVLVEAYRYAFTNTVRASSQTLAGTQHPHFRYDLRGRGDLVMTQLLARNRSRAIVEVPADRTYLLFGGDAHGPVIAEIDAAASHRRISVRPGRYFVRGRGRDYLLEGAIEVGPGRQFRVEDRMLKRTAYARLVRRGGLIQRTHGPEVGYLLRSPLANSDGPCQGGFAGWGLDLRPFSVSARLGLCRSSFGNRSLEARADEADLELRLTHGFDLPLFTIEAGVSAGAALLHQQFETRGMAPPRTSAAGAAGAVVGGIVDLEHGLYLAGHLALQTYLFRQATGNSEQLAFSSALRLTFGVGWRL